jgi:hypothetical protein
MGKKQIFGIVLAGLLVILLLTIPGAVQHHGKIRVLIQVAPADSEITINGVRSSSGEKYLKPGEYYIIASRQYFTEDRQHIKVVNTPIEVDLLPEPSTQEAQKYLTLHPDVETSREAIGGKRTNLTGLQLEAGTPIIKQLPYTDITGPFTIDYGPSPTRKNGIFLIVSNSSPEGRVNALKWIRQQGYDPTNLEIRFDDFVNPIVTGEGESE